MSLSARRASAQQGARETLRVMCVYTYIYIYIYLCIHICIYLYVYVCVYIKHMYIYIYIYIFTHTCTYTYTARIRDVLHKCGWELPLILSYLRFHGFDFRRQILDIVFKTSRDHLLTWDSSRLSLDISGILILGIRPNTRLESRNLEVSGARPSQFWPARLGRGELSATFIDVIVYYHIIHIY